MFSSQMPRPLYKMSVNKHFPTSGLGLISSHHILISVIIIMVKHLKAVKEGSSRILCNIVSFWSLDLSLLSNVAFRYSAI